ncbi:MAG: DUF1214 domain-containing protein [Hyphomonas sp.]
MRTILFILIGSVLGIAAGAAAAFWAAGMAGGGLRLGSEVEAGGWTSDWTIGSKTANPWTRARVARHGLLALTKEEAVYFTTATDSEGRRLSEDCTYRVSGGAMPALWWSITLYDATSYLPGNRDNALSFDQTKAESGGGGDAWTFLIAADGPEEGGWVSSQAAGRFDLTLRLYKPQAALIEDPENVLPAPRIDRLTCAGGAG